MKIYKKWIVVITLVTVVIIILADEIKNKDKVLSEAMNIISNAEAYIETEGMVETVTYYGNGYLDDDEKIALLEAMAQALGVTEGLMTLSSKDGNREIFKLSKQTTMLKTDFGLITIEEMGKEGMSRFSQYITCEIYIKNSPESVCYYADVLKKYLRSIELIDNVTITFVSSFDGDLELEKGCELTEKFLKVLDAEVVEENKTEEIFSVHAYAKGIIPESEILLGNEKININIAMNYNEQSDRTRIYIATPLLRVEY